MNTIHKRKYIDRHLTFDPFQPLKLSRIKCGD